MNETQKTISGRHFISDTVVMDGRRLDKCVFRDCRLIYRGGEPPKMTGCRFDGCRWEFDGAAAQTLLFLNGLYHGGFSAVVESTFSAVRGDALSTVKPPAPESHAAQLARRLARFPPLRIVKRAKPKPE